MAKVACPQCGKLVKRLGAHLNYCQLSEKENEPIVSAAPVVSSSKIKLKFKKSIWVQINGTPYEGTQIEVDDMKTATEIVRIAKDAHGFDILI